MDYHSDKFEDYSLVFEQSNKIVSVLPANRAGTVLASHGGLTYGGMLIHPRLPAATVVDLFTALRNHMAAQGIESLLYKPSPHIFHSHPSEADQYVLINSGAFLSRADLGTAIPIKRRFSFSNGRKDGIRKARKAGLRVRETRDFSEFWVILSEVLKSRHEAVPTHSLHEIMLLASRFPDRIRLFGTYEASALLSGMVVFDFGQTVHAQYIASVPAGRETGALDLLVNHLLEQIFADREWFSFGISTSKAGRELNVGLCRQKEMFGGHSVLFPQYQWDIA